MPRRHLSILIALVATLPAFGQTPEMERAVETAARNFRIQTYETYRTNRPVYNQRIAAAEEALRRFRHASDDVGRIEMQQWFFHAGTTQGTGLPEVPEIQLVDASERLKRPGREQPQQARRGKPQEKVGSNGFAVTDYESNPRFRTRRENAERAWQERQAKSQSTGPDTPITKALKNPGELFGNIGKSFLRGEKSEKDDDGVGVENGNGTATIGEEFASTETDDDYPFEIDNEPSDTSMIGDSGESDMQNALDAIISGEGDSNSFDELNNQIVGQNLAVGLLAEDFRGDDTKSIEFLNQCVDRLENLNITQGKIVEQRVLLGEEQRNELTSVNSLESIANEMMVAVNDAAKQLAAGEIEDADGALEASIGDLRMRLSEVLAEQSFYLHS